MASAPSLSPLQRIHCREQRLNIRAKTSCRNTSLRLESAHWSWMTALSGQIRHN